MRRTMIASRGAHSGGVVFPEWNYIVLIGKTYYSATPRDRATPRHPWRLRCSLQESTGVEGWGGEGCFASGRGCCFASCFLFSHSRSGVLLICTKQDRTVMMVKELSWAISCDLHFYKISFLIDLLLICAKQDHTVMMVKELSWAISRELSFYNISFPFRFTAYLYRARSHGNDGQGAQLGDFLRSLLL